MCALNSFSRSSKRAAAPKDPVQSEICRVTDQDDRDIVHGVDFSGHAKREGVKNAGKDGPGDGDVVGNEAKRA